MRRSGIDRKAPSDKPAFEPYWGKLAVRNLRGDDGDVGIIRSPVRAIVLPDSVFFLTADSSRRRPGGGGWKPAFAKGWCRGFGEVEPPERKGTFYGRLNIL